ncbi:hypothetical protein CDIK_0705 [Cucumispora dikerogammari]|nr:hypothetical protein CDIK_0705 [Cucumispora dikerogammari]
MDIEEKLNEMGYLKRPTPKNYNEALGFFSITKEDKWIIKNIDKLFKLNTFGDFDISGFERKNYKMSLSDLITTEASGKMNSNFIEKRYLNRKSLDGDKIFVDIEMYHTGKPPTASLSHITSTREDEEYTAALVGSDKYTGTQPKSNSSRMITGISDQKNTEKEPDTFQSENSVSELINIELKNIHHGASDHETVRINTAPVSDDQQVPNIAYELINIDLKYNQQGPIDNVTAITKSVLESTGDVSRSVNQNYKRRGLSRNNNSKSTYGSPIKVTTHTINQVTDKDLKKYLNSTKHKIYTSFHQLFIRTYLNNLDKSEVLISVRKVLKLSLSEKSIKGILNLYFYFYEFDIEILKYVIFVFENPMSKYKLICEKIINLMSTEDIKTFISFYIVSKNFDKNFVFLNFLYKKNKLPLVDFLTQTDPNNKMGRFYMSILCAENYKQILNKILSDDFRMKVSEKQKMLIKCKSLIKMIDLETSKKITESLKLLETSNYFKTAFNLSHFIKLNSSHFLRKQFGFNYEKVYFLKTVLNQNIFFNNSLSLTDLRYELLNSYERCIYLKNMFLSENYIFISENIVDFRNCLFDDLNFFVINTKLEKLLEFVINFECNLFDAILVEFKLSEHLLDKMLKTWFGVDWVIFFKALRQKDKLRKEQPDNKHKTIQGANEFLVRIFSHFSLHSKYNLHQSYNEVNLNMVGEIDLCKRFSKGCPLNYLIKTSTVLLKHTSLKERHYIQLLYISLSSLIKKRLSGFVKMFKKLFIKINPQQIYDVLLEFILYSKIKKSLIYRAAAILIYKHKIVVPLFLVDSFINRDVELALLSALKYVFILKLKKKQQGILCKLLLPVLQKGLISSDPDISRISLDSLCFAIEFYEFEIQKTLFQVFLEKFYQKKTFICKYIEIIENIREEIIIPNLLSVLSGNKKNRVLGLILFEEFRKKKRKIDSFEDVFCEIFLF